MGMVISQIPHYFHTEIALEQKLWYDGCKFGRKEGFSCMENNQLSRKYGLFTAICMVVGIVIGSGVFFKAQTILQKTGGDMPMGILAWLIGGAIMLVCLLTFSFMGQKYERVNGLVQTSWNVKSSGP